MCTVLYIPGKEQLCFASLRDENTNRPKAKTPASYTSNGIKYLAPKDGLVGGTWMGINDLGYVIILLNGGLEKHTVANSYRYSRGIIVNDLLASDSPLSAWELLDLNAIEPFTLVVYTNGELFQLVWDGKNKKLTELNNKLPYIWSSVTLYDKEARDNRKRLFQQWLQEQPFCSEKSVFSFFLREADNENGFIMNRGGLLKTLSYSFLNILKSGTATLTYFDLEQNNSSSSQISFIQHADIPSIV